MEIKEKAINFLKKFNNSSDDIDFEKSCQILNAKIEEGLSSDGKNLAMIPTYLNFDINVIPNKEVVVLDAGGSNFRVAKAKFDSELKPIISDQQEFPMMGVDKELSKKEFFNSIYSIISPYINNDTKIGFCFSYNTSVNENLEGILNSWAKEIKCPEVIGCNINRELEKVIKERQKITVSSVILNDTVACALGAKALHNDKYGSYLGLIYGTGMNICYLEETKNIKKLASSKLNTMLINSECGEYNGFDSGDFDKKVYKDSQKYSKGQAEKHCSGRYLPQVIYHSLLEAYFEGLLEEKPPKLKLREYGSFLKDPKTSTYFVEEDKELVQEIIKDLIRRSAKIVSILVTCFANKSYCEKGKKIAISCEGSTFYKLPYFREYFEEYLKNLKVDFELVDGRNLNLVGSLFASFAK